MKTKQQIGALFIAAGVVVWVAVKSVKKSKLTTIMNNINTDKLTGKNYFSDKELTYSATAEKYGINNTPNGEQWANLYALRDNILNPARELYGAPIYVNVAFRSKALNQKLIDLGYSASSTSQHCNGEAADITTGTIAGNRELFAIIVALGNFDQIIWENGGTWIHVSYSPRMRGNILLQTKSGYANITSNWQSYIA